VAVLPVDLQPGRRINMPDNHSGAIKTVDTYLDSVLESVDTGENAVLEAAERLGFGEEDLHKLGMAVREALVNAVVHGNRYSAQKKVHFRVLADEESLTIKISDEGKGFELGRVPDPLAEENLLKESGRGILLIQAFVDEFQVRRLQPQGTEVTMVKYLNPNKIG
jgi:serine/threonine-protein kinase RsbW